MLRSLFSGISGLRSHQTMMDVTGNNIANVNTAGYKSSQTVFKDTLSQLVQGAMAPADGMGGSNPAQVGLGVRVAGISTNFAQGAAQTTGRNTDLMIQGDGFFVVQNAGEQVYTRAGSLSLDADGRLTTPEGGVLQGWMAQNGVIDTAGGAGELRLPVGALIAPQATTAAGIGGNLPADSTSTTPLTTSIQVYDAQGTPRTLSAAFTKVDADSWSLTLSDGTATSAPLPLDFTNGANPTPAAYDFAGVVVDLSEVTAYSGATSVQARTQNGSQVGQLQSYTISPDGTVVGSFSNGLKESLGQLAMATFANAGGLEKAGGVFYRTTANSGVAQVGTSGTGGRGGILGGALEMSNVDLAQEFTGLIIAQRGFQANSRVMTTSDELLQELVNLKR